MEALVYVNMSTMSFFSRINRSNDVTDIVLYVSHRLFADTERGPEIAHRAYSPFLEEQVYDTGGVLGMITVFTIKVGGPSHYGCNIRSLSITQVVSSFSGHSPPSGSSESPIRVSLN